MFKIFPGYDLVEKYHDWKKAHRVDDKTVSRAIRLFFAVALAVLVWCLPVQEWIPGMTIIQKRTLAIFLFAIMMWLFEAVPAWTTSVMVVVLLLFTTSNSSLVLFNNGVDVENMKTYNGLTSNAKTIMADQEKYADVITYLHDADSASRAELNSAVARINALGSYEAAVEAVNGFKADSTSAAAATLPAILTPENVKLLDAKTVECLTAENINTATPEFIEEVNTLGKQSSYKSLLHCFADPIIMLFIGGFILAIAASKTGLDLSLHASC